MTSLTVREILVSYLRLHGYDGLYHDGDCGCEISDLLPCCVSYDDCRPGYKSQAPEGSEWEGDWVIGPKREDGGDDE